MKTIAYAFADGAIGFAKKCPEGVLPIASGENRTLRAVVQTLARRGHEPGVLLVPGMPEAPDQKAALHRLIEFRRRVEKFLGRG